MKTKLLFIAALCIGSLSANSVKISVSNPNAVHTENAPVVVKLDNYRKISPDKRSQLAVFLEGKQISSQIDDLNNDGVPDELVFLIDLKAGQTRKVTLKTVQESKKVKFPAGVYADLIVKEKDGSKKFVKEVSSDKNNMYNALHHHGVAFESALMAYRIYFDNKSTIDVYGKVKPQLELAQTGWYPTDEQAAAGFGDDIIRVFGSVGVGSVKGWDGQKALHIDKFDKRTQRIVAVGNVRAVVESVVDGWQYEGKKINMTVRYILYAHHRDAVCELTASEDINTLTTGVQTIAGGPVLKTERGLVGSWGTDYPVTDTVKYGKQTCGLGVFVPLPYAGKQVSEGLNNLFLMSYKRGDTLRFFLTAVAAKEENNRIKTADDFFAYLDSWSKQLLPVVVK
jgi:hypothetical protein